MSHQSDLPPHVPSCVSTGAGVTVPDATATPRTDANTGKAIAGHYGPSDSTDLYACSGGPFVHADFARTLERELTAVKAEIAYVREESATHEHFKGEAYKIADTWKARAERAEAQLRERTQWQCACGGTDCAGQAENERLRAEVERLKTDNDALRATFNLNPSAAYSQIDQLRARVADADAFEAYVQKFGDYRKAYAARAGGGDMSCDICGRGSCCNSFHSLEEQERYAKVIEAFDHARELREAVRLEPTEEVTQEEET